MHSHLPMRIHGPVLGVARQCEAVLRTLPDWFGHEASLLEYANNTARLPTFVAEVDKVVVGFLSLQQHFPASWEVNCVAIDSAYRNQGLGRALQDAAESWLATQGARVLQVKTLAQSHPSRHYAQTRAFYERAGYIALEVFPLLWEEGLPVLLLVKNLPTVTPSVDLPAARPLLERSATAGRATVVPNLSFELRQWQPR